MPPLQDEPTSWHAQVVVLPADLVATDTQDDRKVLSEKTSKAVRFATEVQIHPVLRRKDMSPAEITKVWMDHSDRHENQLDINNTVSLMRLGLPKKLNEEEFFCSRGLEHLLKRQESNHKPLGKKSIGIALAMQRVLRRSGAKNPVMIARAYSKYTMKSQEVAYKKALYDQAFASWLRDQSKTNG